MILQTGSHHHHPIHPAKKPLTTPEPCSLWAMFYIRFHCTFHPYYSLELGISRVFLNLNECFCFSHFSVCFYVEACTPGAVHMCSVYVEDGEQPWVLFLRLHPPCFWHMFSHWPELTDCISVWPADPGDPPVSIAAALGLQCIPPQLAISHGFWGQLALSQLNHLLSPNISILR